MKLATNLGVIYDVTSYKKVINEQTSRTLSAEFKPDAASLVIEQGYTVKQVSEAMNVDLLTTGKMGQETEK